MKHIYLLSIMSILLGCSTSEKKTELLDKKNNDIDSILVTYFCGNLDSNVTIPCEKIASIQLKHPNNDYSLYNEGIVEVVDTFIIDKTILKEIESLIEKRENVESYSEDARMYVTIKYTDNTFDNICLGTKAPRAMFNNKPKIIDNKLIYLLRTFSGYYKWFYPEELLHFKEYQEYHK